jgi:hypothetical protein
MDLLGTYGSDDSSNDEKDEREKIHRSIISNSSAVSKRSKRLVSLHAVLPRQIFERLTNGGVDSDEEDDEIALNSTELKSTNAVRDGTDPGLYSLLNELGSVSNSRVSGALSSNRLTENVEEGLHGDASTVVESLKQEIFQTYDDQERNSNHFIAKSEPSEIHESSYSVSRALLNVPRPSANATMYGRISHDSVSTVSSTSEVTQQSEKKSSIISECDNHDEQKRTKSRKEIEKSLRSGYLDVVEDSINFHTIVSESNIYSADQQPTSYQNKTGVRIAPVAMYDTKSGTDVVGAKVSGKARSKNQINFLMVSAAAYEASEAQKQNLKSQRASSKRKYGW